MMQLIKNLSEPKKLIIVCISYTAIITVFFLVPISKGIHSDLPLDKFVHISFNAALVFLWLHYFNNVGLIKVWVSLFLVLIFAVVYGIVIEFLQEYFTSSRMADVWDVVANCIGCLLGLFVFKVTSR